jgi:hypothetical protein
MQSLRVGSANLLPAYPENTDDHFDLLAVNLGNGENKSWFAPEHLQIMPYQVYNRVVSDHLTESMLEIAKKTPHANRDLIASEGMRSLNVELGSEDLLSIVGLHSSPLTSACLPNIVRYEPNSISRSPCSRYPAHSSRFLTCSLVTKRHRIKMAPPKICVMSP